jgi:riboflavin kinase / FMN adenylyltransferase
MEHYWSLDGLTITNTWLTIGSFDGVHRGHQEVIRNLTAGAHKIGASAVVLTFHPHPALVLRKRADPFYLTSPEERAALLAELGVDVLVTHPFDREVAALTAGEFMEHLHRHLGFSHLEVGYDFALGRGREGNLDVLRQIGQELGYSVDAIRPVTLNGEPVSSSLVRKALAAGEVERAGALLGRPYQISGRVVQGDGRGRQLGIPTANLEVWAERAIPLAGVYVCQADIAGQSFGAVTNVGVRPTFETEPVPPRVEAHLLDFDMDLYGQEIGLSFLSRLRAEQRFASIQALVEQIQSDIGQARAYLGEER